LPNVLKCMTDKFVSPTAKLAFQFFRASGPLIKIDTISAS